MSFIIPNQTSYVKQHPVTPPPAWTRPADWISITDTTGEVQFLVCDVYPTYSIQTQFSGAGNIYINWGDGTTSTISSSGTTITTRTLSTGGTPCSRGYNTWKVRVYGDPGIIITDCRIIKTVGSNISANYPTGVLEAYYGNGTVDNMSEYFRSTVTTTNGAYYMLEYVKCPATMTGSAPFGFTFQNCVNLARVIMPTSLANATSLAGMFYGCSALQGTITMPSNATALTDISQMFYNCFSLTEVILPTSLNNVIYANQMFYGCYTLTSIQLKAMPACTTYDSMFAYCYNLISLDVSMLFSYAGTMTVGSMFNYLASLEYIKMPTTLSSGGVFSGASLFAYCGNLKSCILPSNLNAASMNQWFFSCYSLSYVSIPTSMSLLTDISQCFSGCQALTDVTLPTTVGATITIQGTFSSCLSLSGLTIPSGWVVTGSLLNTFSNCLYLSSITLPSGTTGITSMQSAFYSANNLKTISIPSAALTGVTTLLSAFYQCNKLTTPPTFPSSMNSCTSMTTAFANCYCLTSVTLPTSMSALTTTGLSGAFQNCYSLTSLTLPATINAGVTSYSNLCNGCYSLKTLTLPTTQTSSVNAGTSMVQNCFALTTMTNEEYIGSTSTSGTLVTFDTNTGAAKLDSWRLSPRISKLVINGTSTVANACTSVRLLNTGTGQYTGTSPQIDASYCTMDATALNQLFTDLPTVTAKTIVVTGNPGAASCTPSIATAKGWTVTT